MEEEKEESFKEESFKVVPGTERTTKCKHDWVFVGMNGKMFDYQCSKCWAGQNRERKL
jgi:hypothetical protein